MNNKMEQLKNEIKEKLNKINNLKELNDLKIEYLSKKGPVAELSSVMKDLDIEEKKQFGMQLNSFKGEINTLFDELKNKLETEALNIKLESEKIDITLPSTKIKNGVPNIDEVVIEDAEEFFISMGYDVVDGPEIEQDKYNFEMLNLPKEHPARDAQDTFYLKDDTILLRSQTSPVQIREMLSKGGNEPVRMICPGKTYRRENTDMTQDRKSVV